MKRKLSILLSFIIIFSTVSIKSAKAQTKGEYSIGFLKSIGLLNDNNTKGDSETVSRSEAAELFLSLYGLPVKASAESSVFTDVTAENPKAGIIMAAYQMGIMRGYGNKTFLPDKEVSANEAVKILVTILGYDKKAESQGGYPSGYLMVGATLEISNDIALGDGPISFADMAILIHKALEVDIFERTTYGSKEQYEVNKGANLLSEYFNIYKFKGQITASYFASLSNNRTLREDEVLLEQDFVLSIGKTNAADLLGRDTVLYAKQNEDEYTIIYIEDKSDFITVNSEDVVPSTEKTKFSYDKNGKIINEAIDSNAIMIYNSFAKQVWGPKDFAPLNGDVTLIKGNGGNYSVIIVNEYKNLIIQRINYADKTMYFKDEIGEWANLKLDPYDVRIDFKDSDGKKGNINNIGEWSIISAAKSEDGKVLKLISSSKTVMGKVNEKGEKEILIDKVSYKKAEGFSDSNVNLGTLVTFYLDYKGCIASVNATEQNYRYGYLMGISEEKGISDQVQCKILTSDDEKKIFNFTEKVSFNGINGVKATELLKSAILASGGYIVEQLVRYDINADGEINEINTAASPVEKDDFRDVETFRKDYQTPQGGQTDFNESIKTNLFNSKYRLVSGFSAVFSVPKTPSLNDKDYRCVPSLFEGTGTVAKFNDIGLYDITEDYKISAIVTSKGYDPAFGSSIEKADVGIVTDKAKIVTEEGLEVTKLYVSNQKGDIDELITTKEDFQVILLRARANGSMISDIISNKSIDPLRDIIAAKGTAKIDDVEKGDVIAYAINQINGEVEKMRLLFRNNYPIYFEQGEEYGVTENFNYNFLLYGFEKIKRLTDDGIVTKTPIARDSVAEYERYFYFDEASVYLYDKSKDTLKEIETDELSEGDDVFVVRQLVRQKLIIVYK